MNSTEILTTITLAVSGWTLLKVINLGEKLSAITERTENLPCQDCKPTHKTI